MSPVAPGRVSNGIQNDLIVTGDETGIGFGRHREQPLEGFLGARLIVGGSPRARSTPNPVQEILGQVGGILSEQPRARVGQVNAKRHVAWSVPGCGDRMDPGSQLGVTVEDAPVSAGFSPVGFVETLRRPDPATAREVEFSALDRNRHPCAGKERDAAAVVDVQVANATYDASTDGQFPAGAAPDRDATLREDSRLRRRPICRRP